MAVIPYLIRKRILKNKEVNIDKSKLIYISGEKSELKKKKKEIILHFILIGVFDFLQKFAYVLYNIIFPDKDFVINPFSCTTQLEIIFQFLCCYFILKIYFYKLQYFALFLNIGIFVIILIIDIVNIFKFNLIDGNIYYFFALSIIFYCNEYASVKKIFLYGYISIYFFMLIKGAIVLIFVLIFSLIMFAAKKEVFIRIGFFLTHKKYILLIIARIFSTFFLSIFLWLIIDRFSPNYLPFSLIFNEIIYFIVDLICSTDNYKSISWDLYFRIVLNVISFIGVMIHNEIVVINICNLGSDTKYFLDLKLENEELFTNTDNPEIIKRYETYEMDSVNEDDK